MAPETRSAAANSVVSTTCTYRLVMVPREWPNIAAMVGSEQPEVLAVVAKEWRKVCGVTPLSLVRLSRRAHAVRKLAYVVLPSPTTALNPSERRESDASRSRGLAQRANGIALFRLRKPELPAFKIHFRPRE
jgi:hypothetical protein